MKVWITGQNGFLGSHLSDALTAEGHEVSGNDNGLCSGDVDYADFSTDCRDFENMKQILNLVKPEVLVHTAALAHEGLSSFSPSFISSSIYEASVATFSAAIAAGVKRIVYMSSMSRYGEGNDWEFQTEDENGKITNYLSQLPPFKETYKCRPVDPYAVAKVAAEDTLKILAKTHSVAYSILVPHNIIGTRQRYNDPFRNVASIMINRVLQGKAPIVYGDGSQTRCFSPVADCIPSVMKAVHGEADGEVVNIGPDKGEITILELAHKIIKLTDSDCEPQFMHDRPNEVKHAYCSSDKARRLLGYEPKQSIDDCLAEMVMDIKLKGAKPFDWSFPIEIEQGCPEVWVKRLM